MHCVITGEAEAAGNRANSDFLFVTVTFCLYARKSEAVAGGVRDVCVRVGAQLSACKVMNG